MLTNGHRRAVRAWQLGTAQYWITAMYASHIVGKREKFATLNLAHDIHRKSDTVERLARAAVTYKALRYHVGRIRNRRERADRLTDLRDARRQLGYGHWNILGKYWFTQEFSPMEALQHLGLAVAGGWSPETFEGHLAPEKVDKAFCDVLSAEIARCDRMADKWPDGSAEATAWLRIRAAVDAELARVMAVAAPDTAAARARGAE